jgi:hypothetical protein
MSELLKLYVQSAGYIPLNQLSKLNINLLKTYYRNNEEDIKESILIKQSYSYINTFYKVLNDIDKSIVLVNLRDWSDISIQNISDEILKDFTEDVKNHLMYIDLKSKYSLDAAVKFYKYLNSDFLKKFENKIIAYYGKISKTPEYEYFAKNFIEILKKIGIKEYLDNYVTYDYKKNTDNYNSVNDFGKRMDFLSYIINDFGVYNTGQLLTYLDVMNERDMSEIIKHYYSGSSNNINFIERFPIDFYYKFPKLFLNFIYDNDELLIQSNIPKEFMEKYGLYEKYEEYVEIMAKHGWEKIKNDESIKGFLTNEYIFSRKISDYVYRENLTFSSNLKVDVSKKIYDYYKNEIDGLN